MKGYVVKGGLKEEFYFWTRKQTHNHLASRVGQLAKDPKRMTYVKSWRIFEGCKLHATTCNGQ